MIYPDADRSNKFQKKLLTRRANQGYVDIIAEIVTPAPGNRQRVFCSVRDHRSEKFQFVELISLHFMQIFGLSEIVVDTSGKSGAQRHHRRNHQARAETSAAGFFVRFPRNRMAAAYRDAASPNARRTSVAGVPPFEPSFATLLAGMRERVGARRGLKSTTARGPRWG